MWNWGHLSNAGHSQSGNLEGTDGRLSACPGASNKKVYLTQPLVHALSGCLFCSPLGGKGRSLTGPFEAHIARRGEGDYVAFVIG